MFLGIDETLSEIDYKTTSLLFIFLEVCTSKMQLSKWYFGRDMNPRPSQS